MKRMFLLFLLSASWSVGLHAQSDRQKVWNLVLSLDRALVAKDSLALGSLLNEDFIGAIPSGKAFDRQGYIAFHCKPHVGIQSIDEGKMEQASIRFFGTVAVVNRRVQVQLMRGDGSLSGVEVQRAEVCHREGKTWKLVSGQGTEVNPSLRPE